MKIGAIIQARTSSTRLPGKVLMNLPYGSNITVLEQVIRRVKKSTIINEITVATTTDEADNDIVQIAKKEGVKWFRGSKENVLERYYQTAKKYHYDVIVRITSDCPCIDPNVIDTLLKKHLKGKFNFTSNCFVRTYPRGVDTEIFSFTTLQKIYDVARTSNEKEHVSAYVYGHRESFKTLSVESPKSLFNPRIRITLDTGEDYHFLCALYDYLYRKDRYFNTRRIVDLCQNKPWLLLLNKNVIQKKYQ